jgi:hypothetical protein
MLWIGFCPSGIVDIVMLPAGETFNRTFFDIVLSSLARKISHKVAFKKSKTYFLHLGNATLHSGAHDFNNYKIRRLPQLAYSPDLAPADFWINEYTKMMLKACVFETAEELLSEIEEIFDQIPSIKSMEVFTEWKIHLAECIRTGGDYL